ncbi:MAG TPA: alpha/beta hydrolase [Ilumatobacter sp.]|nr:alpha/beta hydrolase [Ilumatobacter sp.]
MTITQRRVTTAPGIELDVTEAGPGDGPVVVLLHGFPESAHSWRHQIGPLADAGYRVLVPDQRGYAGSSAPEAIDAYSAAHLTADVCALLDDAGAEQGVIVGHDWGALVTWHMAMLRPERCRAVFAASVPYNVWPAKPTDVFKAIHGDRFFYILYFQEPGVAEAELDPQVERFLRAIYWVAAGDSASYRRSAKLPAAGTLLIDDFERSLGGPPVGLPDWLGADDLATFVDQFERSGLHGPVSWYRNFDTNWELTKHLGPADLAMPTAFVAGEHDPVIRMRDLAGTQDSLLPNHLGSTLIPGAGHWVQQEAPTPFNAWLLTTLAQLSE